MVDVGFGGERDDHSGWRGGHAFLQFLGWEIRLDKIFGWGFGIDRMDSVFTLPMRFCEEVIVAGYLGGDLEYVGVDVGNMVRTGVGWWW